MALVTGPAAAGPVHRLRLLILAALALGIALPERAGAGNLPVPSGQTVASVDILWEGETLVLRFLAPEISRSTGSIDFAAALPDMDALCRGVALPVARITGDLGTEAMIILMDQVIPRGEPTPEATQFISAYRLSPEGCIWEEF